MRMGNRRGAWTPAEDHLLMKYINAHGEGSWRSLPKKAGLERSGKSCRFRWKNYLHPNVKLGNITEDEEELIIKMHKLIGNRWALIAGRIPGRTDNEIKNYWNTYLRKKLEMSKKESKRKAEDLRYSQSEHEHDHESSYELQLDLPFSQPCVTNEIKPNLSKHKNPDSKEVDMVSYEQYRPTSESESGSIHLQFLDNHVNNFVPYIDESMHEYFQGIYSATATPECISTEILSCEDMGEYLNELTKCSEVIL